MIKSFCYNKIFLLLIGFLFIESLAIAQEMTITGSVTDAGTGDVLPGVTVFIKGTTSGTITTPDGTFTLKAKPGDTLVLSFIGYSTQEVPISKALRQGLNIKLQNDIVDVDEVVVIGYGSVKKEDATGSVVAVKPNDMNKGLEPNAQDMITGKIAGVSVISDSGTPGGSSTIRIRGGSSLSASNDPLIVIDGLAIDDDGIKGAANGLSMVNPNDIETFTVLKDASATAIYGSRASNGVIIITTKKGKKGQAPKLSYNGSASVSLVKKEIEVMDGDEYRSYVTSLYGEGSDAVALLGTDNTNWQNEIYRPAVSTDHNVSITGGFKNTPYRVSFGYTNQNGILKTSNFERYTLSANFSPSLLDDYLKINFNIKGMYAKNRYADTGAIGSALAMDPTKPVRSDDEIYQDYFGGYWQWAEETEDLDDTWTYTTNSLATKNPLAMLNQKQDNAKSKDVIGSIDGDYKLHFFPDIKLHAKFGFDYATGDQTTKISPYSGTNNYYGYYSFATEDKYNLAFNCYAQYLKKLNQHNFDAMVGYEWQHFHIEGNSEGYGTYRSTHATKAGEQNNYTSSESATESYLVSFFGRLNYSFKDKYLFTFTLRDDGTSKVSPDNRWGLFPSMALGWKLKDENFLKNEDWLSNLKLRLGWGITGQQNINSGDYQYMAQYISNSEGAYYEFGDNVVETSRPEAYNTKLKWEKTTTYNGGFDLGIMEGRINASVDYYYRVTNDLILDASAAAMTNFSNVITKNIGSLYNQGLEFSIDGKAISTRNFVWDLGFNFTTNKNEITKLTDDADYISTGSISTGTGNTIQAHHVGNAASSFYVYQQVYDEDGKPLENTFVDRNGDRSINSSDMYYYKKPAADVLMGFNSKLKYKKWDFSFSLRASIGNYVYNDVLASNANVGTSGVYSTVLYNKPKADVDLNYSGVGNFYLSDYWIENASFLKCNNITLGYSFKNELVNGRIYLTAQNPFVITKYSGIDPEISGGIDSNIYPRPFVSLLGLSLNF